MWREVNIIAVPGTECGVVVSGYGTLMVIVRRAGEEWPGGMTPIPASCNTIADGHACYMMRSEAEGE